MYKLYFLFLLLLGRSVTGQVTLIPDPNFEQAIIDLGFDTGVPDGEMLTSKAQLIFELDVSNLNISDLTGIEDFSALEDLNCSYNSLNSLNVSQNSNLKYFSCTDNNITAFDVTHNPELEFLNCSGNSITSLDVSQNLNLIKLNFSFNAISTFDVSDNFFLEELICQRNPITSMDVTQNPLLTKLSFGGLPPFVGGIFSSVDLSNNTELVDLSFDEVELTSIDLSNNDKIEYLNCSQNFGLDIDFTQVPLLKYLICSNNGWLTIDLTGNFFLEYLDCSLNQLTELDLSQNSLLESLYCYENSLLNLDLSNQLNLHRLDCQNNQLTVLDLSQNVGLFFLFCNNNLLNCLDVNNGFNYLLTYFNAQNNPDLTCVQVDNIAYSNNNWSLIDSQTSFDTDCGLPCVIGAGIDDNQSSDYEVYPVPTFDQLNVRSELKMSEISVLDITGKTILMYHFNAVNTAAIDLSELNYGTYLLRIKDQNSNYSVKKFLKN